MTRLCEYSIGCIALLLLAGCGSKTSAVHGRVVFEDDSPAEKLAGYTIMFQSMEQKGSASGVIGPDGSFSVSTFAEGDGAVPGTHRVALSKPIVYGDGPQPPDLIAAKYGHFDTSNLTVEIKPGKNEPILKVDRLRK